MAGFFRRLFPRRLPNPSPEAFHQDLLDAFQRIKPDYSDEQQYADFRAVFVTGGASQQQGKRVLWQIYNWGFMYRPLPPEALERAEGGRYLCLCIQDILKAVPDGGERPMQTVNNEDDL